MEPLVRNEVDEVSSLVMENELLRYEVIHLRARLAAAEKAVRKAERSLEKAAAGGTGAEATPAPPAPGSDESRAHDDLVWLLGRLDSSPLGSLIRRRPGFRALRERYLPEART